MNIKVRRGNPLYRLKHRSRNPEYVGKVAFIRIRCGIYHLFVHLGMYYM